MVKKHSPITPSNAFLGHRLERLRTRKDVSRSVLGRAMKCTEKQIGLYEAGAYIPIALLEDMTKFLGEPIQKRIVRRISNARHEEKETGETPEELFDLYMEALPDPYEEE